MRRSFALVFIYLLILSACSPAAQQTPTSIPELLQPSAIVSEESSIAQEATPNPSLPSPFTLLSSAFEEGQPIPDPYTCWGVDISPELTWEGAPSGTQSFALTLDDPDARDFVHWVVWNIPANTHALPENSLPEGAVQGTNDFPRVGYDGPCPPSGTHHYYFRLYAIDTLLDLPEGAHLNDLLSAIKGHILAETELMGTFTPR